MDSTKTRTIAAAVMVVGTVLIGLRVSDSQNMIAHGGDHVCARCKPILLQKLAEGATVAPPSAEPNV